MKKIKRAAILIATAVLACGAVAFSACKNESGDLNKNDGGVKVNQTQWQERLTINVENYDNLTIVDSRYPTYSKSEAAEYGEWESYKSISKVDNKAQVCYDSYTRETYAPNNNTAVNGFVKFEETKYTFEYNGKYFEWGDTWFEYNVRELTKAEFLSTIENASGGLAMASMYASMFNSFNYNNETNTYDIVQAGTMSLSIQFPKSGGIKFISQNNSLERAEMSIEKLNSTTVTVPQQAYTDVDAYLANKNSNGNN